MLACGILAATILLFLAPALEKVAAPLVERVAAIPLLLASLLLLLFVLAVSWPIGKKRLRGFTGLRFFHVYPPLWVAVLVGSVSYLLLQPYTGERSLVGAAIAGIAWYHRELPVVADCVAAVLLVLAVVSLLPVGEAHQRKHASTGHTGSDEGASDEFRKLLSWLRTDEEVCLPEDDRFGHDVVARRIAERLRCDGEAPTMALVGPLGSGKSTIRRIVEFHLQSTPQTRLIGVSLQPYETPEAAVRGVLDALVKELARHVNVLPVIGISEAYARVIEKSAGAFAGIARLLQRSRAPEELVSLVSDIACATGLRFVLWIEDLERLSGGDLLEGETLALREVERLGPIRALLHILDRCPSISVVTSDTSLRTRLDVGKIARFVEQPPELEGEYVWRVFAQLRDRCLSDYPCQTMDPAAHSARERLIPDRNKNAITAWIVSLRSSPPEVPDAIRALVRTPRALKMALRITLETWEALPGEIDFDAVLVASIVRTAYPGLFALVSENIDAFQRGLTDPFTTSDEKREHFVVSLVQRLLESCDQRTAVSLQAVLSFLFPHYPPGRTDPQQEQIARPQALFVLEPANYWKRYLSQARDRSATSDQDVLACIAAWRSGENCDLVERVLDPVHCAQIELFEGQFHVGDLCRLLSEVGEAVLGQSARTWEDRAHAPGISTVWGMMLRRHPPPANVEDAVLDLVRRAAPTNLPLACDLTYYFTDPGASVPNLMREPRQRELCNELRKLLVEHFTGDGAVERLGRAINDGAPWVLRWIAYRRNSLDNGGWGPFENWGDFAAVLQDLAEQRPELGVPLLVPFFTSSDLSMGHQETPDGSVERVSAWDVNLDLATAKHLFDMERLLPVLREFEPPDELDEQIKAHCQKATKFARHMTTTPAKQQNSI